MLGPKQEAQGALFYEFSINDHVPQDHLLRSIDRFVDLSSIRPHLAEFYSHTGRPSIDPELLIWMLLVGYCLGIRSERRLCEEVHLNLDYRGFCRLDLSDPVPNHSTFSKNRHGRFRGSDLLRQQLPDLRDIGRAVAIPIEPIMSDAVLASGQHVDQEPANELICGQGHGGAAACAFEAIVLDAEGDPARVETDQSAVGNGDPVGVA
jgi:transposase